MNRIIDTAHRSASTWRPSGRVRTVLRPPVSEPWRSMRRVADSSSGDASARAGMVMATYAATSATAASNHRAAAESHTHDTAPATAPAISEPQTCPSTVSRELVRTRSSAGGRTCGVMDALTTPKVLDNTSMPRASGYSSQESKLSARITASTARRVKVSETVSRRPPRRRSRAGPITGAISANGATVTSR